MALIGTIARISALLARVERGLLVGLVGAIAGLVLLNVAARALGMTLAWADELAIQAMVLAGFVGASLMLRMRNHPAVQILHEVLPGRGLYLLRVLASALALGFGLVLAWLCWRWFDLPGLIRAGFDVALYESQTFNFLYTEVSPVLGLPMFLPFLVMPWFALTLSLHALANLCEDLGLLPPPGPAETGAAP
ncbi:TRAP transporter small permease [Plastorhodobacter daqingensis]|uniref:TRAP transporter small permease protein n=1 Tax=Plastorhodobacter daqingensis TaxID=1387281 RepID=A0ABW2UJM8_9RHOB